MRRSPAPVPQSPAHTFSPGPEHGLWAVTPATTRLTSLAFGGTLVALAWVWFGRCLVTGREGWMVLLLTLWGWPVALLLLLPHALRRRRTSAGERSPLNRAEAAAQITLWVGLLVLGACIPEFGDAPGSGSSVAATLTGLDPQTPVFLTALRGAGVVVGVAWCAQLLLLATRHRAAPPSGPDQGAVDGGDRRRRRR